MGRADQVASDEGGAPQGPKLSPSRAARQEQAALARRHWREANKKGIEG